MKVFYLLSVLLLLVVVQSKRCKKNSQCNKPGADVPMCCRKKTSASNYAYCKPIANLNETCSNSKSDDLYIGACGCSEGLNCKKQDDGLKCAADTSSTVGGVGSQLSDPVSQTEVVKTLLNIVSQIIDVISQAISGINPLGGGVPGVTPPGNSPADGNPVKGVGDPVANNVTKPDAQGTVNDATNTGGLDNVAGNLGGTGNQDPVSGMTGSLGDTGGQNLVSGVTGSLGDTGGQNPVSGVTGSLGDTGSLIPALGAVGN